MACSDNVSSSSRMASAPRRPSINSSVMVFDLAEDALFAANCLVASGAFDEYVLTGADFASLGPALQDLTAGSSVQQRGTLSVSVAARVFCA